MSKSKTGNGVLRGNSPLVTIIINGKKGREAKEIGTVPRGVTDWGNGRTMGYQKMRPWGGVIGT